MFIQPFTKWHLFINIMGRFWNMLATAVLGGASTEINQVLMGIQSTNKYFDKITDWNKPCDQRFMCMGIYEWL